MTFNFQSILRKATWGGDGRDTLMFVIICIIQSQGIKGRENSIIKCYLHDLRHVVDLLNFSFFPNNDKLMCAKTFLLQNGFKSILLAL